MEKDQPLSIYPTKYDILKFEVNKHTYRIILFFFFVLFTTFRDLTLSFAILTIIPSYIFVYVSLEQLYDVH